jgi:hypothetical protein
VCRWGLLLFAGVRGAAEQGWGDFTLFVREG